MSRTVIRQLSSQFRAYSTTSESTASNTRAQAIPQLVFKSRKGKEREHSVHKSSTSSPDTYSLTSVIPSQPSSSSSASSSSNSSSSQGDAGGSSFAGLSTPQTPIPRIRHPFDTNRFVETLERTGEFSRGMSEEIMRATKALLVMEEERASRELVAKQDLENEAYLFSAALSELKTEVQVRARNDAITLRSASNQLQREVDSLTQKLREDIQTLKNDNQLDFNNRKDEAGSDLKLLEDSIMDLNRKFTLLLGDARTDLETSKWVQTRRAIVMIAALAVLCVAYVSSKPARAPATPPAPPTIDSLGVKPVEEPEPSYFTWLTSPLSSKTDTKPSSNSSSTEPKDSAPPTREIPKEGIQSRSL